MRVPIRRENKGKSSGVWRQMEAAIDFYCIIHSLSDIPLVSAPLCFFFLGMQKNPSLTRDAAEFLGVFLCVMSYL